MANESPNVRTDPVPVFLAWGMPQETSGGIFDEPALWLTGGATLLLWTVVALLLTAS